MHSFLVDEEYEKSKKLLEALEEITSYSIGGLCYDGALDIIKEMKEIAEEAIKNYNKNEY